MKIKFPIDTFHYDDKELFYGDKKKILLYDKYCFHYKKYVSLC